MIQQLKINKKVVAIPAFEKLVNANEAITISKSKIKKIKTTNF